MNRVFTRVAKVAIKITMILFYFIITYFLTIYIYLNISKYEYLELCLNSDNITIENGFRYYLYNLFTYILIFIIFFSIILKKLTELYADTDTYEYIMLMKELDILLKENKPANASIINILKKYSPDVMLKGSDWKGKPIVGEQFCKRIEFFKRIDGYSTTEKIQDIINRR